MEKEDGVDKSTGTSPKNSHSQSQDGISGSPAVEARFTDLCKVFLTSNYIMKKEVLYLIAMCTEDFVPPLLYRV